jgi:hypothetical protein
MGLASTTEHFKEGVIWNLIIKSPSASGDYSTKSAYDRFMAGSVSFEPATRIWISWAPQGVNSSFGWLL